MTEEHKKKISKALKGKKKSKQHIENVAKALQGKKRPNLTAEKHPNWMGGKEINGGYVFVYCPNHPSAHKGKVAEHRLIMERFLGRLLSSDEIVHHIDGNRRNNSLDNLMLMTRSEHMIHHLDKIMEALNK